MPRSIVIFGASGDLTRRKLIPALYQLHRKQRLPADTRIVGFSRSKFSHDQWRAALAESTAQFAGADFHQESWKELAGRIFYQPGDIGNQQDFADLSGFLEEAGPDSARLYYLATAPRFYEPAVEHLGACGMAKESQGSRRIVVEKPFGRDLASSQQLNRKIQDVFHETQIYRIDHYLGKETVQNLLVLRFANTIFEPVWNRNYIDHVQITVAEEVGVGTRGSYYDSAGIIRDMFQNHLLQLLMITAMEVPIKYESNSVRDEKVKVLHAMRPVAEQDLSADSFRGQYREYTSTEGVPSDSQTETFAAIKLWIDNWRWQGVPFYLRSGKSMSCRTTQIVIQFRPPPHMLFRGGPRSAIDANRLVVQVQPAEGIQLHFETKVPDAGMKLRQTDLDFNFQREFRSGMPEAYERLLLDALEGDASLFARADEVEAAWRICDPIIQYWQEQNRPTLYTYEPGCWGPPQCTEWMQAQNRQWFDTCPVL